MRIEAKDIDGNPILFVGPNGGDRRITDGPDTLTHLTIKPYGGLDKANPLYVEASLSTSSKMPHGDWRDDRTYGDTQRTFQIPKGRTAALRIEEPNNQRSITILVRHVE